MSSVDPRLTAQLRELVALTASDREARLTELAAERPADAEQLRAALATLLAATLAGEEAGRDAIVGPLAATDAAPQAETAPISPAALDVGPFRLLKRLGAGAMGEVWQAEQRHPKRQVALKLIRGGLGQGEMLARFVREANLLARVEHPAVARVYEAGSVDQDGRTVPYLAMELVSGKTLGEWAAQSKPSRQRCLQLMAELTDGVHAAHLKGVLHRDLKPDNILVDEHNHPKILDFGVARALNDESNVGMTQPGQLIGTLAYMSPEQLMGDSTAVDARSDVYALGAIAYELLAARPVHELSGQSLLEALRSRERLQPKSLGKVDSRLAGDVEAVVMTALAGTPSQRYSSAAMLAEDFRHLLADQPVRVRSPSALESAGRLIKRHRWAFAGVMLIALSLLAATLFSWRSAQAEAQARAEADQRTVVAEAVTDFLNQLLSSADPQSGRGAELSVRDLLDEAVANLDRSAPKSVQVELSLRELLATAYRNLAQFEQSQAQVERVQAMQSSLYGADSLAVLDSEIELASLLIDIGELHLAVDRLSPIVARTDLPPALKVRADSQLGRAAQIGGDPATAADLLRKVLPIAEGLPADPPEARWRLMQTLAIAELQLGEFQIARERLERLIAEKSAHFGPGHIEVLRNRSDLATALDQQGEWQEAEQIMREVYALEVALYGEDNLSPISTLQNLAKILIERGQLAEAAPMLDKVAVVVERELGTDHPQMLFVRNLRAALSEDQGDLDAAETEYRELIASHQRMHGIDAPEALIVRNNLAGLLMRQGRQKEALELYFLVAEDARKRVGEGHYLWGIIANNYGDALVTAGRAKGAVPVLERSLKVLEDNFGPDHERVIKAKERLQAGRQALAESG